MKFPLWLKVYGSQDFRGDCPLEGVEQATFFAELRRQHPETWGILALHPKNEDKRRGAQFQRLKVDKAMGLSPGASDVVIPLGFCCEIKRRDHAKSKWQPGQIEYLQAAHDMGGFACVALGWEAAWEAFEEWLKIRSSYNKSI